MKRRHALRLWPALALCTVLLAGCALPARQLQPDVGAAGKHWSGRMALQVQDSQQQSFSAGFELQGWPERGTLLVFNPLGSIIARLEWTASQATLQQGEKITSSASLSELIVRLTGSDIPVAALFDWLQGRNTAVSGWQTDLSRIGEGRLRADRFSPQPEASLRIVLDQDPQ
ncbi:lipoprotein insertase outer membrane protein LolB [Comamonas guangdongensis]|uniref:Outer-membrane lipoprotein LolB n=1 Tax=Comamonas guangdongensis TaxID=510515 RepID=A0ABV3ZSV4_9BURK